MVIQAKQQTACLGPPDKARGQVEQGSGIVLLLNMRLILLVWGGGGGCLIYSFACFLVTYSYAAFVL